MKRRKNKQSKPLKEVNVENKADKDQNNNQTPKKVEHFFRFE